MDQERLETQGLGYICRRCGITVLSTDQRQPWLCTSCRQATAPRPRSLIQEQYERAYQIKQSLR